MKVDHPLVMQRLVLFHSKRNSSFSLVEVVLAIGVAAFVLIAIVGMLPVGLKSINESVDESRAINILSSIIADRFSTPFSKVSQIYGLPALTNTLIQPATNFFGITDDDQFSDTDLSKARYRVDYIISPPVTGRRDPYQAWFKVSWPAKNTNSIEKMEVVVAFPQP